MYIFCESLRSLAQVLITLFVFLLLGFKTFYILNNNISDASFIIIFSC